MGDLDRLNEAIALNYLLLPFISAAIYVLWLLVIRKNIKSVWYISLAIPGTVAFLSILIEYIFFPPPEYTAHARISLVIFFLFCPGYIVPLGLFPTLHLLRCAS